MRRVAILAGLAVAVASQDASDVATKNHMMVAKARSSMRTQNQRIRERIASIRSELRQKVKARITQPGRRLVGENQCAWTAGMCELNSGYANTVVSASSPLRDIYDNHMACSGLARSPCAANNLCTWTNQCEAIMDTAPLFGDLVPAGDCGWLGELLSSPGDVCEDYTADGGDCTEANHCEISENEMRPNTDGYCELTSVCRKHEEDDDRMLVAMCGADFALDETAMGTCLQTTMEGMGLTDAASATEEQRLQMLDEMVECALGDCPPYKNLMGLILQCDSGLSESLCTAISHCRYRTEERGDETVSECEADTAQVVGQIAPANCPIKHVFDLFMECSSDKTEEQCTGNCGMQHKENCHGEGNFTIESECGAKDAALFDAIAAGAGGDARAAGRGIANLIRIEEHCATFSSEADCEGAECLDCGGPHQPVPTTGASQTAISALTVGFVAALML